ncbi:NAD-glutamate dehydrogenase [Polycladidibacter stylochi]|uniref:NAD-glutamate dehydrogenase n=1 Tax=Polycladidibacter stylochi TaxID=1807766 RepID=UPI00082FEEE5|nr:NAD-glutamate dehydrogenase [Pseudovibrio stylochi]
MSAELQTKKNNLIEEAIQNSNISDKHYAKFVGDMFAQADAQDLCLYHADELAHLSTSAWELFQNHSHGTSCVNVFNPPKVKLGSQLEDVTILEILNDNMPFLVSSVMGELQEQGLDVRLVLHPLFVVERESGGLLKSFQGTVNASNKQAQRESLIHIHIPRLANAEELTHLKQQIELVLSDVKHAVSDWKPMCTRLSTAIEDYQKQKIPFSKEQLHEAVDFLQWMADDNFTLLGMREYIFEGGVEKGDLSHVDGSGLGILKDPKVRVMRAGSEFVVMSPEIREFLLKPEPLFVAKANVKSRVHRHVHMDYIGVKLFDAQGVLTGELRIVGLFTSTAYNKSVLSIPYLREKTAKTMDYHGYDPESHSGRALRNILEAYPRDDLFQIDVETLCQFTSDILQLNERPRLRVLTRIDKFDRFASVLVFVPRDHFSTKVRKQIGAFLANEYKGRVSAWYVSFLEGPLVRVHFIIGRNEGKTPSLTQKQLEDGIGHIVRTWNDNLYEALKTEYGAAKARHIMQHYAKSFDGAYTAGTSSQMAVYDIRQFEQLSDKRPLIIKFQRENIDDGINLSLRTYHQNAPIELSARVPILENMGFGVINERTYRVRPEGKTLCYLHDTTLRVDPQKLESFSADDIDRLGAVFLAAWFGTAESDGYNALALTAEMGWRDIAMLRALSRYLRQTGILYSEDYMWGTLNRFPEISKLLVELFHTRFNPALQEEERSNQQESLDACVKKALDTVSSLDDDRIIRRFTNLIEAILRTNFYRVDEAGQPAATFAFKIDSHKVDDLPKPTPYREIFVYSPRVEGVHMRFGSVARGGLRWSDRAQDYRTEVLGLVKAQQVKNAVIVPVGAKGGFLPKKLPENGSREEVFAEGTAAYKTFIASLLEMTDNIDGEAIVPPLDMVRHDSDDPYLVVAADKGTATFSDTANGISEAKKFWLGDAFASGGSAGYDHKKMGITARGAWEAVKRHFREMDRDIQKEPFTVCGVGDMSGDVFGNGMLLSRATKLVAAFDHRDIFIDSNPDPATSFEERKRLFQLGRSSWQDYNKALISQGGGIFSRKAKSIPLTLQIKQLLDLQVDACSPQELMTAILKMQADLMWFGGIGTYIRATSETNAEAGDRANDAIRITAADLRVKVIGEGANLGITQKARIEFAQNGGRCNSDAIDNSAGVNSSDMEVNIKIALGTAIKKQKLDVTGRNQLLEKMTDEVAELVLRNNYLQTLAISLSQRLGIEDFGYQVRMMRQLEQKGHLDRAVEFLPADATLEEMEKQGQVLSRPEIGVIMAYGKLTLYDILLSSDVPDDEYLGRELARYFPREMNSGYLSEVNEHRLRREIIATMLANSIINRGGPTFVTRIVDQSGASPEEIAKAFAAVRDSYGLTNLNEEIDALDNLVSGDVQLELYAAVQELVLSQTIWFLRNLSFEEGIASVVDRFAASIERLSPRLEHYISKETKARLTEDTDKYVAAGVPIMTAARIARLSGETLIPDIVMVSEKTDRTLDEVAEAYFMVSNHFRFDEVEELAREFEIRDYYDGLALDRARMQLAASLRELTSQALAEEQGFTAWLKRNEQRAQRSLSALNDILDAELSVSRLSVASATLAELCNRH